MGHYASANGPLNGVISVPGDKSISHRALIFGALAEGVTTIDGLLEADDVLRTAACLRAVGVEIEKEGAQWRVFGRKWVDPTRVLYTGNAGTGSRLLMGALAGQGVSATFDGDASLRKRPMDRILDPLRLMGLHAEAAYGKLPAKIEKSSLKGVRYRLPVASAQIKSAILLAALGAVGETVIEEPELCRDHTEKMLQAFGARLNFESDGAAGRVIKLEGPQELTATHVQVPADPSSAAFPLVAALITPGSEVTVTNVLLNPSRTGLFTTLLEMGADLVFENQRQSGGEQIADITARYSKLQGVSVPAERAASMIDEYPVLAIAASQASGETFMQGLAELRVKESDRLAAVAAGLAANGVDHKEGEDWLKVRGGEVIGGGLVATHLDHRIAMSFLVLGLASKEPVKVDSMEMIATSFPNFTENMEAIGAQFSTR